MKRNVAVGRQAETRKHQRAVANRVTRLVERPIEGELSIVAGRLDRQRGLSLVVALAMPCRDGKLRAGRQFQVGGNGNLQAATRVGGLVERLKLLAVVGTQRYLHLGGQRFVVDVGGAYDVLAGNAGLNRRGAGHDQAKMLGGNRRQLLVVIEISADRNQHQNRGRQTHRPVCSPRATIFPQSRPPWPAVAAMRWRPTNSPISPARWLFRTESPGRSPMEVERPRPKCVRSLGPRDRRPPFRHPRRSGRAAGRLHRRAEGRRLVRAVFGGFRRPLFISLPSPRAASLATIACASSRFPREC